MVLVSEASDVAAIIAAINAAFTASAPACTEDDGPSQSGSHMRVSVQRRYTEGRDYGGNERLPGYRLIVRYVGKKSGDVDVMRAKATQVLDGQFVGSLGPFVFESAEVAGPDGGWFTGDTHWTY